MGHANLLNISEFFINRLYAKGSLSIDQCADALVAAGETLHASEGEYDDKDMLAMGLIDIVNYLSRTDPSRHGFSGPKAGGPWIIPDLNVWYGKVKDVSPLARDLLDACSQYELDPVRYAVAADKLEEDGHTQWAEKVRVAGRRAEVFSQWISDQNSHWDSNEDGTGEYDVFEEIPWRFAPGWRKRYREVPRLSNVTH